MIHKLGIDKKLEIKKFVFFIQAEIWKMKILGWVQLAELTTPKFRQE